MKKKSSKFFVLLVISGIFVLLFSLFLSSLASSVDAREIKTLKRVKRGPMTTHPIKVHYNPNIKSRWCGYGPEKVLWSGKRKGAYIQIYFKDGILGWVFGDYYGVYSGRGKYIKFEKPVLYRALSTRESRTVMARERPNVLSRVTGCCRRCMIWVVGKRGSWLHTYNNKWIYEELMESVKDQHGNFFTKEK